MMPFWKDSLYGALRQLELARVYTRVGELDAALEEIDSILERPGFISVAMLELDPRWEPLREHPGYRELIEKYE